MSSYKLRIRTKLPAALLGGTGISIVKNGLVYTVAEDWSKFANLAAYDPSAQQVLIQSTVDGSFALATIAQVIAASQTQQIKTTAGDVAVAANDGAIIVNKTAGGATNINFPLAGNKVGDCLVADFKGDAGTNNITINPTAPETIMGQASYIIAANGGSVRLKPIAGVGYAI